MTKPSAITRPFGSTCPLPPASQPASWLTGVNKPVLPSNDVLPINGSASITPEESRLMVGTQLIVTRCGNRFATMPVPDHHTG